MEGLIKIKYQVECRTNYAETDLWDSTLAHNPRSLTRAPCRNVFRKIFRQFFDLYGNPIEGSRKKS